MTLPDKPNSRSQRYRLPPLDSTGWKHIRVTTWQKIWRSTQPLPYAPG
ncbi:MAG: hypothetical protein ACR2HF_15190 [Methylococcaceae bacterium]